MVERKRINRTTYLISHPKAGRTWIRVMMGRVLYLSKSTQMIKYAHDGMADTSENRPAYFDINTSKNTFSRHNVILLMRDPRDLIVSYYFEVTRREKIDKWNGISDFIRDDRFGISTVIQFYNMWCSNRNIVHRFLLIKYEDLKKDCRAELKKLLKFVGIRPHRRWVTSAVRYGSFDSMRKIEDTGQIEKVVGIGSKGVSLRPGDSSDPESYKTRRGKVGGYVDYLSTEDIDYCNERMKSLDSWFAYEI